MTNQRIFSPDTQKDHLTVSVNLTIKLGVDETQYSENLASLMEVIKNSIRLTGALVYGAKSTALETSPYVGSKREKLLADAQYDRASDKYENYEGRN